MHIHTPSIPIYIIRVTAFIASALRSLSIQLQCEVAKQTKKKKQARRRRQQMQMKYAENVSKMAFICVSQSSCLLTSLSPDDYDDDSTWERDFCIPNFNFTIFNIRLC